MGKIYLLVVFSIIILLSISGTASSVEGPGVISAIISIEPPSKSDLSKEYETFSGLDVQFENTTITKFVIPVVAEVINPNSVTVNVSVGFSSHSQVHVQFNLINQSIIIQDYLIQSPSISKLIAVEPGRKEFVAEGEIFVFNHTTDVLPEGNYKLYYNYGQDETYYGYVDVENGQYMTNYDNHTYTDSYTIFESDGGFLDWNFSLLVICLVNGVIRRKLKCSPLRWRVSRRT